MLNSNCHCFFEGARSFVLNERRTFTSEILFSFVGCLALELGIELGWFPDETIIEAWLEKALLSSGTSATYAVLISMFLRFLHEQLGEELQNQTRDFFCNLSTVFSQLLSGSLAFGAGILVDYLAHLNMNDLKSDDESTGWRFLASTGVVLTKVVSRIGFYKGIDYLLNKKEASRYEDLNAQPNAVVYGSIQNL